jgi:hypothetical protein
VRDKGNCLTLFAYRFEFEAMEQVRFGRGLAGNTLRGAFGTLLRESACDARCPGPRGCASRLECSYARLFEPACLDGPSGMADAPRPLVLRAAALDNSRFSPGERFAFDMHVFDVREPLIADVVPALTRIADAGLGGARSKAVLRAAFVLDRRRRPVACVFDGSRLRIADHPGPIEIPLETERQGARRIHVRFVTPTELKSGGRVVDRPWFDVVATRARDRVSALSTLYGRGQLAIDFRGISERAQAVKMVDCEIEWHDVGRRSSRTGQKHDIGGFTGRAAYEGKLDEFLPFLEAAYWTGIGRQTVWGKGMVVTTVAPGT